MVTLTVKDTIFFKTAFIFIFAIDKERFRGILYLLGSFRSSIKKLFKKQFIKASLKSFFLKHINLKRE
jgi:hypothetical protein